MAKFILQEHISEKRVLFCGSMHTEGKYFIGMFQMPGKDFMNVSNARKHVLYYSDI